MGVCRHELGGSTPTPNPATIPTLMMVCEEISAMRFAGVFQANERTDTRNQFCALQADAR